MKTAAIVAPTNCAAVDWGPTQWCGIGKHDRCDHRVGGHMERGVWLPECYVTVPASPGSSLRVVPPSQPKVISPSHVYRCPCECHSVGDALPTNGIVSIEADE